MDGFINTLQLLLALFTLTTAVVSSQTSRRYRQRHYGLAALAGVLGTGALLLAMVSLGLGIELDESVALSMLLPLLTLVLTGYVLWRGLLSRRAAPKLLRPKQSPAEP